MSDLYKTGENVKCKICDVVFYKPKSSSQKCCSQKCGHESTKRSGVLLGNKNGTRGGYREKGGRGKQGWYKGYYCNSSWELAWVMYNLDHGIEFDRNTKGFQYSFNGKVYNFYPDFKIKNTEDFVEVKGYLDEKNKAKISSFPHKLTVLGKKEIVPFIKYAKSKYGEDYINLYE